MKQLRNLEVVSVNGSRLFRAKVWQLTWLLLLARLINSLDVVFRGFGRRSP